MNLKDSSRGIRITSEETLIDLPKAWGIAPLILLLVKSCPESCLITIFLGNRCLYHILVSYLLALSRKKEKEFSVYFKYTTFTLKYPVGWSVKQNSDKVKLYNSKQDSEFLEVLTRIDEADDDSETSTPSNKFDSKEKIKLPASEDLDEDQEKYLILRGNSKEYFADIVESVKLEDNQTTDGE